jgi:hypothetical protein
MRKGLRGLVLGSQGLGVYIDTEGIVLKTLVDDKKWDVLKARGYESMGLSCELNDSFRALRRKIKTRKKLKMGLQACETKKILNKKVEIRIYKEQE